jgi:hypothetical protein
LYVVGNDDRFALLRRESVIERVVDTTSRIAANLGIRARRNASDP